MSGMSSEKFNRQSQMEHMQMKYVGTGHADITKFEWVQNQHRDSQASYIGHTPMLHLFSAAQNKSLGRVRYEAITRMVRPIGRNPLTAATAAAKDDE